ATSTPVRVSERDNLLFAKLRFGSFWTRYALGRGALTRTFSPDALRVASRVLSIPTPQVPAFTRDERLAEPEASATVSVILPTIDRYPYLRRLLAQIAQQTYPVHEIIVVDQTPEAARQSGLEQEFPDLPLHVIVQDPPGQCTARNLALRVATGTHALFLDDDD